ncbi:DUF2490 domain-containing protein [Rufibacter roseus]|uniref:DUF2490 domain-containing protein n=1 Tax=Rufibacter roseus TaxID=1567108 RepID=A0ABW2DFN2_9BACT|nr:DUF2490 domain-containing protein [Rufibacter roseus]
MKKIFLGIVLWWLMPFTGALAQRDNINNWMQYTGTYRFSPSWSLSSTVQYRTYNAVSDLRTFFGGTEAQFNLQKAPVSLVGGFAYLVNRRYNAAEEKSYDHERRLYQQISHRDDIGRVNVTHRYQIEERWLDQEFHVRFRYSVALRIPFGPAEQERKPVYGILRNEIRVIVRDQPFDSNRISGGLGFLLHKGVALEGTWMSQLGARNNHQHFTMFVLRQEFGQRSSGGK